MKPELVSNLQAGVSPFKESCRVNGTSSTAKCQTCKQAFPPLKQVARAVIEFTGGCQTCKQAFPPLKGCASSIAWEAASDKVFRGPHFGGVFWRR